MENHTTTEVQNLNVLQPNKKEWIKPAMIELEVNMDSGSNDDGMGMENS